MTNSDLDSTYNTINCMDTVCIHIQLGKLYIALLPFGVSAHREVHTPTIPPQKISAVCNETGSSWKSIQLYICIYILYIYIYICISEKITRCGWIFSIYPHGKTHSCICAEAVPLFAIYGQYEIEKFVFLRYRLVHFIQFSLVTRDKNINGWPPFSLTHYMLMP